MRGMLRQATIERVRSLLLCTEGGSAPDRTIVRFKRPCQCVPHPSKFTQSTDTLPAQILKKDCVTALRRIFKLCDTNKDGILDAAELNEFQVSLQATVTVCMALT